MITLNEFSNNLSNKKTATTADLALYKSVGDRPRAVFADGKYRPLDSEDNNDQLDSNEKTLAQQSAQIQANRAFWEGGPAICGDNVDRRPFQTPVKDQDDRGTCVCFASLGNLEALWKAANQNQDIDLSEQYANWLYMHFAGLPWCEDGLRTTLAANYLSKYGVCAEVFCPYEDLATVKNHCAATDGPATGTKQVATFGIGNYTLIDRLGPLGLSGPSIANTDYLEGFLCAGKDIVFGTHVAWGTPDANGVLDVILDQYGNPLDSRGGHAMIIVGYDRRPTTPIPYFILKNSWGTTYGNAGYLYLSYDYIRQYGKYGYVVDTPNWAMPAPPF